VHGLEGRASLTRVFDFNRLPGARALAAAYLRRRCGFEDDPAGGQCAGAAEAAPRPPPPRLRSVFAPVEEEGVDK
jgi:hypothetical protein